MQSGVAPRFGTATEELSANSYQRQCAVGRKCVLFRLTKHCRRKL